ncbi:MAG: NADAR family protein [Bdellovibrionales bacterium]|nr:NADAR family protein [Bdellovibrionales bacterium]
MRPHQSRIIYRTPFLVSAVVLVFLSGGCASSTRQSSVAQTSSTSARPQGPLWQRGYPTHWWAAVEPDPAKTWEILPQEAQVGEVILSKRHELGLLSNFAATPFEYRGKRYASLEGFWQAMKYPENAQDPRARDTRVKWQWTRQQVEQMTAFEAKRAGDLGSENMKALGIDWVTFEGRRMTYKSPDKGEHYRLILDATRAKLSQNQKVREVLLATGSLRLRPDHHQEENAPPEWRYFEIWEQLRSELRQEGH